MSNFIEKLVNGNLEDFRNQVFNTLYAKAEEALNERKVQVASSLYSPEEETIEEENIPEPVVARRIAGGMDSKTAKTKKLGFKGKHPGKG
jgi:hypothetical protein